jgi:DNA-binding CsgD family transcriptional regulator
MSNPEISDRLFLSPRTVSTHVERVLRKLGVANRVAAAVHAMEFGLGDPVRNVTSAPVQRSAAGL